MSVTTAEILQDVVKQEKERRRRYIWTGTLMAIYSLLRSEFGLDVSQVKPDIMIAGIPIYNINKIGHAASDEIMKYRSMGGVFLAHQKGGKKTLLFKARFFGPSRFLFVKALEALQLSGTESAKKILGDKSLNEAGALTFVNEKKGLIDPASISPTSVQAPLIEYTNYGEFKNQIYAFHRTFPIITETRIYMNMYMETFVIKRDIKFGRDAVEVQCAFREYDEPTEFQRTAEKPDVRRFYRVYIPDEKIKKMRLTDFTVNFAWAIKNTINDLGFTKEKLYKKEKGKFWWEFGTLATLYGIHTVTQKIRYG